VNRNVAVGDGVASFFEWGDVQRSGVQARKKLLEVSAKFCEGIGTDLDGGEMPHAGKKIGDVGLGRGRFGGGFRSGEQKSAALGIKDDGGGEDDINGIALFTLLGNHIG